MHQPALRPMGRSGLVVSPVTLGTMTLANAEWGSDEITSGAVLDRYLDGGGNAVDTAATYGGGAAEELLGRLLEERKVRQELVLATRYGFTDGERAVGGSGRADLVSSLEGSLRRLRTEHVDLYWLHRWDGVTPAHEIVRGMDDLIRVGKVRYYGLSDVPAWFAAQVTTLAGATGAARPVAIQVEYSLVARGAEREHLPAARELGLGVAPRSPLAGGFLTGKYRRVDHRPEIVGRLAGSDPSGPATFTDADWRALDVARRIAAKLGRSPAEVALAWVLARGGVDTVVVGARTPDQLGAAESALRHGLPPDDLKALDEETPVGPYDLPDGRVGPGGPWPTAQ